MNEGGAWVFIVALIAVSGWFWHDHHVLLMQIDEAHTKITKLQDNITELQQMADEKGLQATELQSCLDAADTQMHNDLVYNCKIENGSDCDNMPAVYVSMLKSIQDERDKQKEFCFKQFPQH